MAAGVQLVLKELKAVGFVELETPLRVAGAEFEFEATAVGTGVSHDLVLVATEATAHERLVRLTEGLSRALDHLRSRRPVTLIYIGDAPSLASQDQLERSVRLLLIRAHEPNEVQVRQAIAVLMPLALPTDQGNGKEPISEVLEALGSSATDEHRNLIQAAQGGADEVRRALKEYIDDVFDEHADELRAP
jgi:hypothetical protein